MAAERDVASRSRDQKVRANSRQESERIGSVTDGPGALDLEALEGFLGRLREYQVAVAADRRAAAEDRRAAAEDRSAAARDRELAAWARQQGAVEAAEVRPDQAGVGALESAQRAAALAGAVAESEERIAATLRDLDSSTRDPVASERRRAMAEEAAQGAMAALRRGERLRELAEVASDHLGRATRWCC